MRILAEHARTLRLSGAQRAVRVADILDRALKELGDGPHVNRVRANTRAMLLKVSRDVAAAAERM